MSYSFDLHTVVQRDPEIIGAEAGEDIVMVSIANGKYYAVADVAKEIWRSVQQPISVSALIDRLMEKYKVDREECERDTLRFLNQLLSERLLVMRNAQDC